MNIADRCIKWMEDVIEVHKDLYDTGDVMEKIDIEAIEDAEYIIKCIKMNGVNIDE